MEVENGKSINLDACRFCLKVSRSKIKIDGRIKTKYQLLMNEKVSLNLIFKHFSNSLPFQLLESPKLSQNCCKTCVSELDQCVSVKNRIFDNQKLILKLAGLDTKQEEESLLFIPIKTEIEEKVMQQEQNTVETADFDAYQSPSPKSETSNDDYIPIDLPKEAIQDKDGKLQCGDCGKILSKEVGLRKHRARFHPSNDQEMLNFLKKEELVHSDKRKKLVDSINFKFSY